MGLEQVNTILLEIIEDESVPRNIKDKVGEAVEFLNGGGDFDLLKDSVNEVLDDVIQDPNLPLHTRTQIWTSVSILESLES